MDEIEQFQETLSEKGYEYVEFLGKGGFSSVLLCRSKKYQQYFAIKRANKHQLTEEEYNHLKILSHPNIIKLYDAFEDSDALYLVMEYCSNGTIQQKGVLSYEKFIHYAKQILEAISFCHSNNIAHRDIKPSNIFLNQYDQIKLADFGLAKQFQIDGRSNEKCGSLLFLPPEMFQYHEIDPFKADIWAVGITFFYMTTGTYPFKSSSQEGLKHAISIGEIKFEKFDIHPKIKFLISKMTAKNIENRLPADKLLELPIFKSVLPKLSILQMDKSFSSCRRHSHVFRDQLLKKGMLDNYSNENKKKIAEMSSLYSYRSPNLNPKMARVNCHFQPVKLV